MGVLVKRHLSEVVKEIGLRHGIPYVTVETVLKEYLQGIYRSLARGERVVIQGITSITPVKDLDTGEIYVRGRVSPALRARLAQVNLSNINVDVGDGGEELEGLEDA